MIYQAPVTTQHDKSSSTTLSDLMNDILYSASHSAPLHNKKSAVCGMKLSFSCRSE